MSTMPNDELLYGVVDSGPIVMRSVSVWTATGEWRLRLRV